jgi:hypothetical protein
VVHVQVPAQDAPEDALEGRHARAVEGARDELEVELDAGCGELVFAVVVLEERRRAVVERRADVGVLDLRLRKVQKMRSKLTRTLPCRKRPQSRARHGGPRRAPWCAH